MQKLIPKLFLTNHAGNPIPFIAIGIKENESRNSLHLIFICQFRIFIYIYRDEIIFIFKIICKTIENWFHPLARTTPACCEINDTGFSVTHHLMQYDRLLIRHSCIFSTGIAIPDIISSIQLSQYLKLSHNFATHLESCNSYFSHIRPIQPQWKQYKISWNISY